MQLGMIGLGRMGGNMTERLRRGGHQVVGYDRSHDDRDVDSLEDLVAALEAPRVAWAMVPSGHPTAETVERLATALAFLGGLTVRIDTTGLPECPPLYEWRRTADANPTRAAVIRHQRRRQHVRADDLAHA